jgi:beta-barrel assembly-enhancing protease
MKKFSAKKLLPLLVASVMLTRCSCDFFGTTGSLLISEADEMKLGAEFDTQLRTVDSVKVDYPIYKPKNLKDSVFQNYVIDLAKEIVAAVPKADKPGYPFTFTLIDAPVENAFAVPGGYVYIYTGIIKKMKDEAELTGVLGHEIAHVTRHHYRDAMAKDAALSILLQTLLGNDAGKLTQLVAGSFYQLASLKVTRGNEAEADEYGTIHTALVNRNPLGIAKFFGRYPGSGFGWLSTHPDPPDRVGSVTAQVNAKVSFKALAADSVTSNFQARFELNTAALPR